MSPARAIRALRESFETIEESAREQDDRQSRAVAKFDYGPFVVCVVGGLSLVMMEYVGVPAMLTRLLGAYEAHAPGLLWGSKGLYMSRWMGLLDLGWWIAWRLVGFFALPAMAIRFVLKRPIADFGLRLRVSDDEASPRTNELGSALPIYAGLYLLLLPMIVVAALRPEFSSYYPFYKRASESWFDLLTWELMYAVHFVALEFFFRGFWLEASRRALGVHAIAFMTVPYCMLHFTKPALEVVAAIPAGFALGALAMRTRSIWGGAALHIAVAWTMDLLAIALGAGFPSTFWPY